MIRSVLATVLAVLIAAPESMGLVVPVTNAPKPAVQLREISLPRVGDGKSINLGDALEGTTGGKTMLVLGTHPGDFNMVEYAQKVRAFWPQLKAKGVDRCMMVVNGEPAACTKLAELLDIPGEVELLSDPAGEAGRRFGVSRGFRPDDPDFVLSPTVKLFFLAIGIGPPWMTLPAVLTGYFGNPNGRREWIESALQQGQLAGRWPTPLKLDAEGKILANEFDTTPLVSGWGVRPFELATLRLQNLVDVQLKHRDILKPSNGPCLTQLGGFTVVGTGGEPLYSWLDQVPNPKPYT